MHWKVFTTLCFEDKRYYKRILFFKKIKEVFVKTLWRRTNFWDIAFQCGSDKNHNVVLLNPNENKFYLLTQDPTLKPSFKKISPETIRAKARNPIKNSQSIVTFSRSDIQHHIRTQELQEVLTKMDTIPRHSIDQNLRKLTETAGFSVIFHKTVADTLRILKT